MDWQGIGMITLFLLMVTGIGYNLMNREDFRRRRSTASASAVNSMRRRRFGR